MGQYLADTKFSIKMRNYYSHFFGGGIEKKL